VASSSSEQKRAIQNTLLAQEADESIQKERTSKRLEELQIISRVGLVEEEESKEFTN